MKFSEIVGRVTGFSVPIFGVQWNPPESGCTVARRVISFLEDRRVLYVASEMETPEHCVKSVFEIRRFLTDELGKLQTNSGLSESLKAMRAACRKFIATTARDEGRIIEFGFVPGHYASWEFNGAIGELKGVFGLHIAALATMYGLDVGDDLARILPIGPDDDIECDYDETGRFIFRA